MGLLSHIVKTPQERQMCLVHTNEKPGKLGPKAHKNMALKDEDGNCQKHISHNAQFFLMPILYKLFIQAEVIIGHPFIFPFFYYVLWDPILCKAPCWALGICRHMILSLILMFSEEVIDRYRYWYRYMYWYRHIEKERHTERQRQRDREKQTGITRKTWWVHLLWGPVEECSELLKFPVALASILITDLIYYTRSTAQLSLTQFSVLHHTQLAQDSCQSWELRGISPD